MLPADTDMTLRTRMEHDIAEMNVQLSQAVEMGRSLGAGERQRTDLVVLISEVVGNRSRIIWLPIGQLHTIHQRVCASTYSRQSDRNALRYSPTTVEH